MKRKQMIDITMTDRTVRTLWSNGERYVVLPEPYDPNITLKPGDEWHRVISFVGTYETHSFTI